MTINKSLYSSVSNTWVTPQDLFERLHKEFNFTVDLAASPANTKLPSYFNEQDNSLIQTWTGRGWLNPPYGRGLTHWVEKAWNSVHKERTAQLVVMLIPARPDTKYWHEYILNDHAQEIRFIKGRLKFSSSKMCAPFPSAIIIYRRSMIRTITNGREETTETIVKSYNLKQ